MPAPLIAAAARGAAVAARGATRSASSIARGSGRTARTEGTEAYNGVRNAQAIRQTKRQEPVPSANDGEARGLLSESGTANSRYQTIDQTGRSDKAGSVAYRSVKRRALGERGRKEEDENTRSRSFIERNLARQARLGNMSARANLKMQQKLSAGTTKMSGVVKKARALAVSQPIIWTGLSVYSFNLFFALLSAVGLGLAAGGTITASWLPSFAEDWGSEKLSAPGMAVYAFGHMIYFVISAVTLIAAATWYTIRRVKWFSAMSFVCFILAFAFYLTPIVQFFPWFLLFVFAVVFTQK